MSETFASHEFSEVAGSPVRDERVFLERAANIARYLKNQAGDKSGRDYLFSEGTGISLQRILRHMEIQRRPDTLAEERKKEFTEADQAELEAIFEEGVLDYKPDPYEMWVHLEPGKSSTAVPYEQLETRKGEKLQVSYKTYFTISQLSDSAKEVKEKALHFAKSLPDLMQKIDEIEKDQGDIISVKFLHKLVDIDSHSDNIVIHCRKPETREKILLAVHAIIAAPLRIGRVNKGFDFESSVSGSNLDTSHSGLVAEAITACLIKILESKAKEKASSLKSVQVLTEDEEWLAGWLKEKSEYYGNLSPLALANSL